MLRCPACGLLGTPDTVIAHGRAVRTCAECGHKFIVLPYDALEEMRARYQGDAYFHENYNSQGIASLERDDEWVGFCSFRVGCLRRFGIIPETIPAGYSVLEIGCLEGRVLNALAREGCTVAGVEINAPVAEAGQRAFGVPITIGTAEQWVPPRHAYDAIFSFHTFEHLVDPAIVAERAWRALKPGGSILLEVPCDDDELDNMDHFHFFTERSGTRFLDRWFDDVRIEPNMYMRGGVRCLGSLYMIGRKAA